MLLFCGSKVFRQNGRISALELSVGNKIEKECFTVFFNDNSKAVLPQGSNISLIDGKKFNLDSEGYQLRYGTRSRFKVLTKCPQFSNEPVDPYIIGIGICSRIKNNGLYIKRKLDISKLETEYFSFNLKKTATGASRIISKDGYPNLLPLEIKKQGNFKKLSQKFIPDEYLFATKERRLLMLQGCMDIFGKNSCAETTFETCSYQLANDITFLVRSIGGFAKIRIKKSVKDYFIVSLSFPDYIQPFRNFKNEYRPSKKQRVRSIEKIERAGIMPCLEIPVDSIVMDNFIEVS